MSTRKSATVVTQALKVEEREVAVHILVESRNNARVSITKSGVVIRLPRHISKEEKLKQIDEFKNWAVKKLRLRPELYVKKRKDYFSNQEIIAQGQPFKLQLQFTDSRKCWAELKENIIHLQLSTLLTEEGMEKLIAEFISRCMANYFHSFIGERLTYWNNFFHPPKQIKSVRLKYVHSLWGSCSHNGNITISTRLLLTPEPVLNYVLLHEVAHLYEHNHSKKFWQLVACVMPDYENSVRWLREHGSKCDF